MFAYIINTKEQTPGWGDEVKYCPLWMFGKLHDLIQDSFSLIWGNDESASR